jgi:hypothetical protein
MGVQKIGIKIGTKIKIGAKKSNMMGALLGPRDKGILPII